MLVLGFCLTARNPAPRFANIQVVFGIWCADQMLALRELGGGSREGPCDCWYARGGAASMGH
jgi:hypothetical protein